MSVRMQQWNNMVSSSGIGNGVNTYQYIKAQNHTCGSATGEAISTFLNLGMGIAQTAMTQKATAATAEQKALTKTTGNVATGIQNYSAAKIGYDTAQKELEELEAKKADSSSDGQAKIQKSIDDLDTQYAPKDSDNAQTQAEFQKFTELKSKLTTAKGKIDSAKKTISENQTLASQDASGSIGNSGLSVTYTEGGSESAVAKLNSAKSDQTNSRYYKPDPNDSTKTVFMDALFNQDMQVAQQMDQKNQQIKDAKKKVADAQKEISDSTKDLDGVSPENIDSKLAECEQKLSELGQKQLTGSDGKSMSVTDFNSQKNKLNEQLKTAKENSNNADLDKQIAAKKKEVATKKEALTKKKTDLESTRNSLQAQVSQMKSLNNTSSVDSAKTQYKAAKAQDKRSFFQKVFGGGKSQDTKDAKAAYQKVKSDHNTKLQAFQAGSGYSANAANIAQLEAQIKMINEELAKT